MIMETPLPIPLSVMRSPNNRSFCSVSGGFHHHAQRFGLFLDDHALLFVLHSGQRPSHQGFRAFSEPGADSGNGGAAFGASF
jgi:hypothetical protein